MPDHDMRDVFARDVERVELPPPAAWIPTTRAPRRSVRSGLVAIPAFAGVIVLALVAAFAIQLVRGDLPPQVGASPSAVASASATTPENSVQPSRTVTPTASATPTTSALPSSAAVRVTNRLPASGQWALILRRSSPNEPGSEVFINDPARDSISAVPLTGGQELPLVEFVGIAKQQQNVASNQLGEEISPDGRRVVLSVFDGDGAGARLMLVVVDLVAGSVTGLTSDPAFHDTMPAWSPRGDQIAFMRRATGSAPGGGSIWVVRSDGSGLRQVLGAGQATETTGVFGWNGDGTRIGYFRGFEGSPYFVLDPATGATKAISDQFGGFGNIADWREGSPAFVGALKQSPRTGTRYIVTADQTGGGAKTIVTDSSAADRQFMNPRWRPGSDDILYVGWTVDVSGGNFTNTLFVTDASGRTPRTVATSREQNLFAAWTPDGRGIVYLSAQGVSGRLVTIAPDGSNERVLIGFGGAPEARFEWLGLVVLSL